MTVNVTSLNRRSAAQLRAFVQSQRLGVERDPDSVEPANPSDRDYWRYLVRRVPLEGRCLHYQTYDAWGDENDWNINIAPDPQHRLLVDPGILHALSLSSGAPDPIDPGEIKHYDGVPVVECELTPDDALYDTFISSGLPITSGGVWPDGAEQEGLGPTGERVGVYGVFAGDYGHGGRPEIHPFDAFWRRFHEPGSSSIAWDLGVFQDDSNRFNSDWSRAPISVEFRVPFCLDIPVTLRSATTQQARFRLRRSPFCSVVGKNTRSRGASDLQETFLAPTVQLNRRLRNRLVVSVEDDTGVPGRPFSLSFADLSYTTTRSFPLLSLKAWLAGVIVIRIAIDQDGFAYWTLRGPNSTTAVEAEDGDIVVGDPDVVIARLIEAGERRRQPVRLELAEARAEVIDEPPSRVAVEVELGGPDIDARFAGRRVTVHPREEQLLVDDATGDTIELDSFDLFASASIQPPADATKRVEANINGPIAQLAGIRHGFELPSTIAAIEMDDQVIVDLGARYVPYRRGEVSGEERSRLADAVNRANLGAVDVVADVRIASEGVGVRRRRVADDRAGAGREVSDLRLVDHGDAYRLEIGPFDEPTAIQVEATLRDRFGLESKARVTTHNFRVIDARRWVERATGISPGLLRGRYQHVESAAQVTPTPELVASAELLRTLIDVLESLDGSGAAPASRVAGTLRLAVRVEELLPAKYRIGVSRRLVTPTSPR